MSSFSSQPKQKLDEEKDRVGLEFEQCDLVEHDHWLAKGKKENLLKKKGVFHSRPPVEKTSCFLGVKQKQMEFKQVKHRLGQFNDVLYLIGKQ